MTPRQLFVAISVVTTVLLLVWSFFWIDILFLFILVVPIIFMGVQDVMQKK
ncbi:MAG: hypothetical protein RI909_729, partial [Bacteroidota bacterium]